MTATGKKWKISRKDTGRTHENYKKSRNFDGMIFWIFEQHAPATAMPPIISALQFPISNHASGTHSSPLLGDRHAPGGTTSPPAPQGQPLQANNATRDAQACFCPSSADLHDRPLLEDARTARLRANSNLSQLGSHKFRSKSNAELHICFPHRTKSNTEITSLHCERSNKTEWHLSPRGDLGIFYYFIIHSISCSLLRMTSDLGGRP